MFNIPAIDQEIIHVNVFLLPAGSTVVTQFKDRRQCVHNVAFTLLSGSL